eukprot:365634-Chlamydomonas_euryale.AAC.8
MLTSRRCDPGRMPTPPPLALPQSPSSVWSLSRWPWRPPLPPNVSVSEPARCAQLAHSQRSGDFVELYVCP